MLNQRIFDKQCPGCHGAGEYIEPVLDYGEGPSFSCGYCDGQGRIYNKNHFYRVLGWLSSDKRKCLRKAVPILGDQCLGSFKRISKAERESNKSQARMFVDNAKQRNN